MTGRPVEEIFTELRAHGITVLASLGVFVGGACWSWLYLRYRSVWPCYVSHAIVDVPIFVLGYRLIFGGG